MMIKGRFLSEWVDFFTDPVARFFFKFKLKRNYPELWEKLK